MKLNILIATLFASFALVACGDGDSNSDVQGSSSIDAPATTGPAGTTTPTQSLAEEAAGNAPVDESEDILNEEGAPGAVEQASNDDNPLSAIPRDDLPQVCLDYFQELEDRLRRFPEARGAAITAAEEIKRAFESMEGDLEQFAQTCQDRYEDFKQANEDLDERLSEEHTPR